MTVIATALKHLMAAGVTGDALIAAIAEIEAALPGAQPVEQQRSKAAIRQERYRRNKASQNVTNGITSVTDDNESVTRDDERNADPLPLPPNELISNPPTPAPEKHTPRARKGSTIPDDWMPQPFGSGTIARSIVDGWPPGELQRVAEHFASHHRAKGTVSKNWHDSWSTWVHNTRNFKGLGNGSGNRNGNPGHHGGRDNRDGFKRACDDWIDEAERPATGGNGPSGQLALGGPEAL